MHPLVPNIGVNFVGKMAKSIHAIAVMNIGQNKEIRSQLLHVLECLYSNINSIPYFELTHFVNYLF